MKKILLLFLFIGLFTSCGEEKEITTTKMELRQLLNKEETTKYSRGSYFLIMANYSSDESTTDIIKMYVKVDNTYYKMLKLNLEDVRIVIDNSITIPYLIVTETGWNVQSDEQIIKYINHHDKIFLHCPEKYLPEKLLTIEIN